MDDAQHDAGVDAVVGLEEAAGWIAAAERVTVLTGAGISTDSGIPDFRGPERRVDEEPGGREDGDAAALPRRPRGAAGRRGRTGSTSPAWTAEPNAGHRAIVELERRGKLHAVVTQNVDGLHQRAGTDPAKVIEVHGTMWWTRCWECRRPAADGARRSTGSAPARRTRRARVCGGILKSDTISFGQTLVPEVIDRAMQARASATCCSPSARR